MDIKVDINSDDIDKAVKTAIINSAIGKMITEKVKVATNDYSLSKAVDDMLKQVVASHIRNVIYEDESVKLSIKQKIAEKLNDELIDKIAGKIARAVESYS